MADDKIKVNKGLAGVIVDESKISKIMPESNSLTYRGYKVQDLCETCRFEEVAYLLLHDDLPTASQLEEFERKERSYRNLSSDLLATIQHFPKNAHPMDSIRTAVSFMGMEDSRIWDNSVEANRDKAIRLLAQIPGAIAADYRLRKGKEPLKAKSDLSLSENFFYQCFGEVPSPETVKAFDVSLILYAEHTFNASTFTTRVITSTTSDLYSAMVGGIGALKGPLHGGANEQVMYMMKEIGEPSKAKDWLLKALAEKRKIMGFGHRVYRNGDSRVPTMKKYALKMAEVTKQMHWMEMYDELDKAMVAEKGIHPNLDFPAGPAYYMMGFEIEMFTPIFVMARTAGWAAHIIEQTEGNKIIRPLNDYTGPAERAVKALAERH